MLSPHFPFNFFQLPPHALWALHNPCKFYSGLNLTPCQLVGQHDANGGRVPPVMSSALVK